MTRDSGLTMVDEAERLLAAAARAKTPDRFQLEAAIQCSLTGWTLYTQHAPRDGAYPIGVVAARRQRSELGLAGDDVGVYG